MAGQFMPQCEIHEIKLLFPSFKRSIASRVRRDIVCAAASAAGRAGGGDIDDIDNGEE
ncbi:hypothetical protein [Stappia sp. TSB10P1A]|uniref:hypothetical protein n=1 Tax=Stappia sp. TSB10P1A TaxID=2003585 RepID=UPI0016437350|nr:hypothetical protein [Stappia sp. TSB10P1A]